MRRILMLALTLTFRSAHAEEMSASEQVNLLCMGWSIDRYVIATTGEKHQELSTELRNMESSEPGAPLAQKIATNLDALDAQILKTQEKSRPVFEAICSP